MTARHDSEPAVGAPGRPRRRPGGRSARVRTSVLEATVDVLAERGYGGLSIDDVARRAGVHKTTVYRRWPTKAELVLDAVRERSLRRVPVPDTGSFRGDLAALARSVAGNVGSGVGAAMTRTLVAAGATSPTVAEVAAQFWSERLGLMTTIVDRAVARGEVPSGTDPIMVIEALIGPLYVRLLLTGEPVDESVADAAAALVAAGSSRSTLAAVPPPVAPTVAPSGTAAGPVDVEGACDD